MKTIIKTTLLIFIFFTTSCSNNKKEKIDNRPTVNVTTSKPKLQNTNFITTSGKIEAVQNANLSTRVMGHVTKTMAKVGEKVRKGQLLLSINSNDINAQKSQANASITEAKAAYDNAEKNYNRFKSLYQSNSISQKEMDNMTANFKMAKARLEAAKQRKSQINAQLFYTNITAPFSGVITGKYINKGDMASPGIPLISIENTTKFQVITAVPESEITHIKKNTKVNVIVKSSNQIIKGEITEISTSAKNTGGQYLVKIALNKTTEKLLSGMFTSVQFLVEKSTSNHLLIPTSALIKKGELTGVYVVGQNNIAILRWLRTGKTFGNKIEVLSGLNKEEQYITSSESKLINGAKLHIK